MTLPQPLVISHSNETAFKPGGLRDYSAYRDLSVAEATRGLAHPGRKIGDAAWNAAPAWWR